MLVFKAEDGAVHFPEMLVSAYIFTLHKTEDQHQ